jgi:hypothetical protein
MGSLIPVGGGADAEIKLRLNTAFDDSHIDTVRTKVANENIFGNDHHLHRVAYRLGTYPVRDYSPDDAKGKWFYFLKKILKDAQFNGVSTTDSIRKVLSYAIKTSGVKRVVFDAIEQASNFDHYVSPNNPIQDADIAPLVDSAGTLLLTLVCPSPLRNNSAPTPDQNADLDRDSQGHIIEKPPIKIFTPTSLAPPALKKKKNPSKKTKAKKGKTAKGSKGKKTRAKRRK